MLHDIFIFIQQALITYYLIAQTLTIIRLAKNMSYNLYKCNLPLLMPYFLFQEGYYM